MAVLEFKTYHVEELYYQRIGSSSVQSNKSRIRLTPAFKYTFTVNETEIAVRLSVVCDPESTPELPFELRVTLTGSFVYHATENDLLLELDQYLRQNALAILYPYARNLVSMLTLNSNEFPALVLPTVNITKLAQQENNQQH